MTVPRGYAALLPAYLAGLLALDTQVSFHGQLALGALTFAVLAAALWPLAPLVQAQAVGVVLFATSWWLRRGDVAAVPTSAVALNVIAFVGLGISGWIGGNMVYRHKMAVLEHADPEATAIGQRESA